MGRSWPFGGKAGEHLGSTPGTKARWLVSEYILDYGVP